jgi:pathogen-inducible salicylic acid glucosyltransferase
MLIKAHVLCLPLHAQGHINPVLQFCKRLASRGIKTTVLTSVSTLKQIQMSFNLIKIESLPDSTDELPTPDDASWEKLKARYLKHLRVIIQNKAASGEPVKLILFDATMPWAMDVAEEMGIPGAIFFTQSCADCAIYCHVYKGILKVPLEETNSNVSLPSLPPLEKSDLPSFIYRMESWPFLVRLLHNQYSVFHKADWILVNSFESLEPEVHFSVLNSFLQNFPCFLSLVRHTLKH